MIRLARFAASIGMFAMVATPARAQGPPASSELRLDALAAAHTSLQAGVSIAVPAGVYTRTSITAASGLTWLNGTERSASRLEIVSRFLLDPFREADYGLSLGGGIGVTNAAARSGWRPYLALVMDLELAQRGRWTPAVQVGLGGGARLGVVMRSGAAHWR